jgi:hypothetical protein
LAGAICACLTVAYAGATRDRAYDAATSRATVSVREFGAVGDGRHDDTPAFVAALRPAPAAARCVQVPPGTYLISSTLTLEGQSLVGSSAPAWPADIDTLPSILPAHRDGPAFRLKAGGVLQGIDISYQWRSEPTSGPAAVVLSGIGCVVRDTRIRYAWDGIVADGTNNVGRANIENVFMVTVRNVGVRLTGTWDVPRLHNIEVWNTAAAQPGNHGLERGTGFLLGKNDLVRLTDCFVFGMHYGFLLQERINGCPIEGPTWGVMNGCSTDFCGVGLAVEGGHTLSVSGGSFWDHGTGLLVRGEAARVRVSGSELKSNGAPAVQVESADHVVVTGCGLLRPMEEFTSPTVLLKGGTTVLGSNHIESATDAVRIGPGVKSALVQGNSIFARRKPAIVDESSSGSKIRLEANLDI